MLARIQQCITLGALALASLWGVWCWRQGQAALAVAGLALACSGHALVLGLEFLFLRQMHRDDPTPRASIAQLLQAWWREALAAPTVFCWRQPFRSQRFDDRLPDDVAGRRGVLLLHGFVCNRGLWNPWLLRLRASGVPVLAINLEPVFGSIDDYVDPIEGAVRRLELASGMPPVVVAHSMGGLALRRWWVERDGDARIHRALTIGTPHRGTWLARCGLSTNARQMRLGSRWLQALAAREPSGRFARFTCFYGHCDNIVFPPQMATLPGAENRHIPGVAHMQMVDRPEPWQELQRWLAPTDPAIADP